MELTISCAAIFISLASLVWNALSVRRQRQAAAVVANHSNILNVESMIADVPSVLRFHGIVDPEQALSDHGVTSAEFAYILGNFTIGGTYFRTSPKAKEAIGKGTYRYDMCESQATRRAWPLLRRMITKSPYRDRLDEIFSSLNRDSAWDSEKSPSKVAPKADNG